MRVQVIVELDIESNSNHNAEERRLHMRKDVEHLFKNCLPPGKYSRFGMPAFSVRHMYVTAHLLQPESQ